MQLGIGSADYKANAPFSTENAPWESKAGAIGQYRRGYERPKNRLVALEDTLCDSRCRRSKVTDNAFVESHHCGILHFLGAGLGRYKMKRNVRDAAVGSVGGKSLTNG